MSLERFTAVLRARWWLMLMVWLAVIAAVAFVSTQATPRYKADVALMVEPRLPDPTLGIPALADVSDHLTHEMAVLRSERVVLAAVRAIRLDDDPFWKERWLEATGGVGDPQVWLAEELGRELDVRPTRRSNIVTVSFSSPDPAASVRVVNAVVQSYIQTAAELRLDPARHHNAQFEQVSARLRQELEQAHAKLANYQRRHGVVTNDDTLDVETSRLTELSSQVAVLQATVSDAEERRRQSGREGFSDLERNPAVFALSSEITRQENRLTSLLSRLGDQHPDVIDAQQTLAGQRAKLESATRRAAQGIDIDSRMARDRLAQARRNLEEQRRRVLALKAERSGAQVLQREVDNAQRAYDAVLTRTSQTTMEAGAVRGTVSVLKSAAEPTRPYWPRPKLMLAAGAVAGLLIAVFVVLWREAWDRRLRTSDDVTQLLRQNLLVALPDSSRSQRRQLALAMRER